LALDETQRKILEIVLDQRSVANETIAPQVDPGWTEDDVSRLTAKLKRQGLIAETAYASDRWSITEAGRAALTAE
jgi:DNA-binding Lrp family transcriptional regulator